MTILDGARFKRVGNTLVPVDLHAQELLDEWVVDGADTTIQRAVEEASPQHQAWFRVMMQKAFDNLPEDRAADFPTVAALTDAVKIACGHYKWHHTITGARFQVPDTLKGMKKDDFKAFSDLATQIASKLIGVDVTTLAKETDVERKPRKRR